MAPSARSTRRRGRRAAPLAQSTTTRSPSSAAPSIEPSTDVGPPLHLRRSRRRRCRRRPRCAAAARPGVAEEGRSSASRAASTSSDSFVPPAVKSLTPLSAKELCDAEITAPATPSAAASQATAGVGTTPSVVDVDALGREPGDAAPPRAGARTPGVAPDDEPLAAEHPSGRPPEREHELGGEVDGSPRHARRRSRTSASGRSDRRCERRGRGAYGRARSSRRRQSQRGRV